jgi:hypothetical protein
MNVSCAVESPIIENFVREDIETRFAENLANHKLANNEDKLPKNIGRFFKYDTESLVTSHFHQLIEKIELLVPIYLSRNILGERIFPNITYVKGLVECILFKSYLFLFTNEEYNSKYVIEGRKGIELKDILQKVSKAIHELPYVSKFHNFSCNNWGEIIGADGSLTAFSTYKNLDFDVALTLTITGRLDWESKSNKPKALLLTSYNNDKNSTYYAENERRETLSINRKYNLQTRHVNNLEGAFREIDKALDIDNNLEIIILKLHGDRCVLAFYASETDNIFFIDNKLKKSIAKTKDITPNSALTRLKWGAKVILCSCCTGEGKSEYDNMANSIARIAPHIHVIAPTTPFTFETDIATGEPCFFATEDFTKEKYAQEMKYIGLKVLERDFETDFQVKFRLSSSFMAKVKEENTYHIRPCSKSHMYASLCLKKMKEINDKCKGTVAVYSKNIAVYSILSMVITVLLYKLRPKMDN